MFTRLIKAATLLMLLFCLAPSAQAHIGGVPFFKVNGDYTLNYPVPVISVPELPLPQDSSPAQTYLTNTPINFEIDTKVLKIPDDVLAQTHLDWDFGDGAKATGLTNSHTYTKPGSYIINIFNNSQLIESMVLNSVPTVDYKLPVIHFEVNHQSVDTPAYDFVTLNAGQEARFDASATQPASAPIRSIDWNFSDGTLGHGPQVTHTMPTDRPVTATMIRATDANNLFTDSYAQIQLKNSGGAGVTAASPAPSSPVQTSNSSKKILLIAFAVSLVVLSGGFILLRQLKKR